jgi:hypothetical protein
VSLTFPASQEISTILIRITHKIYIEKQQESEITVYKGQTKLHRPKTVNELVKKSALGSSFTTPKQTRIVPTTLQ